MSAIAPSPWTSSKVPLSAMPEIQARLLSGEKRERIGEEYGVSGRWISSLVVRYLHATGETIYPGITRRIRSERKRGGREAFKALLADRNKELAIAAEARGQLARREEALALPREQRTIQETPMQRDVRRRSDGYLQGCF